MKHIDFSFMTYSLEVFLCSSSFLVFAFWLVYKWIKEGQRPNEMYCLFTLLFLVRAYSVTLGAWARSLRGDEDYYQFMSGVIWYTRNFPEILVLGRISWIKSKEIISYFIVGPKKD